MPARPRRAVHRGHDWLRHGLKKAIDALSCFHIRSAILGRELATRVSLYVGSGAEGAAGSGEYRHAYRLVVAEIRQGGFHGLIEGKTHRVEPLGSVETEDRRAALLLVDER